MSDKLENEQWTEVISAHKGLFDVNLSDIWKYRDLIYLFVKRDIVTGYKQTILGPLWYVIQPILTTFTYTLVFSRMAGLSTDGVPPIIFYMLGTVMWSYFSTCLNKTSGTFAGNAGIFGKVYFPRLTVPIATVMSSMIFFFIQLFIFLLLWAYYLLFHPGVLHPNWAILWIPYILILMAAFGLGIGIILSSLTTKYRDFNFLVGFGVQLWMYASPIIYPSSLINTGGLGMGHFTVWANKLNPITPMIEITRYAFLGKGEYSLNELAYATGCTIVIVIIGVLLFNRIERTFMDTV